MKKTFIRTQIRIVSNLIDNSERSMLFCLTQSKKPKLLSDVVYNNAVYAVESIDDKTGLYTICNSDTKLQVKQKDLSLILFKDTLSEFKKSRYGHLLEKENSGFKDNAYVNCSVSYNAIQKCMVPALSEDKGMYPIITKATQKDVKAVKSVPLYKKLIQKDTFDKIKNVKNRKDFINLLNSL